MASAQRITRRYPSNRRRVSASGKQHRQYEAELQKISKSPYLNSEDLLEEIN